MGKLVRFIFFWGECIYYQVVIDGFQCPLAVTCVSFPDNVDVKKSFLWLKEKLRRMFVEIGMRFF